MEAGEPWCRTRGHNAPLDPFEIPAENVIGMNVAVVPFVGSVILFVQSPWGIAATIMVIVVAQRRGV